MKNERYNMVGNSIVYIPRRGLELKALSCYDLVLRGIAKNCGFERNPHIRNPHFQHRTDFECQPIEIGG